MAQGGVWDLWWRVDMVGGKMKTSKGRPALTTKKALRRERPNNVAISNCCCKIKLRAVAHS